MRVARVIAWLGVFEIGAVIWYGAGFYLGWWGPLPQQALLVFALGVLMITAGTGYSAGWHGRGEHDRARAWRAGAQPAPPVASLPAGAGPVDASLDTLDWNRAESLLSPRVVTGVECAFGGWLGPRPGRAICSVAGCWHIATEPRGPGWSRTGNGGWLCPCESRHDLIGSQPTAAM